MPERVLALEELSLEESRLIKKIYAYARALSAVRRKPMYTREFLAFLNNWGDSFLLLKELERKGLIERKKMSCIDDPRRICVYNFITSKGREFLKSIEAIVQMIEDWE